MNTLKYTVIRNRSQYKTYSNQLEELVFSGSKSKEIKEEIDLLTVLIEKWDVEHSSNNLMNPIQLLESLMAERNLKGKDLVDILNISKGYASEILNYKKGLSKDIIRKLSYYFKVNQEAFNRRYELTGTTIRKEETKRKSMTKRRVAI